MIFNGGLVTWLLGRENHREEKKATKIEVKPKRYKKLTKEYIEKKLTEKEALNPCSRCGGNKMQSIPKYFKLIAQDNPGDIVFSGPTVPCTAISCENCGAMVFHALGALDSLDSFGL
jgi:hypothetical protein